MKLIMMIAIGILLLCIAALVGKICLLRRAAREILRAFHDRLETDTNTLIDISSRDSSMRSLADGINRQLRTLRQQRQRYFHGDRELKEAVTNISHDLRTPLTAICGYLELLKQEVKSETAVKYLAFVSERTDAMRQLTEELFQYTMVLSADGQEMETVCMNAVLEESIAGFYGAFIQRGITPQIRICEAQVERKLNPSALNRVFHNLLSNAVKYSDGDLEITLCDSGEILFCNAAARLSRVQVGKLFDRFFTVEEARESTGLGLAISKTLVEQMNGTISADYDNNRLCICVRFTT